MASLLQSDIDIIVTGFAQYLLVNPALTARFQGPQGPPGPPGIPGATDGNMQIVDTRWRIEEFGLFEPDLPIDDRHPDGDIIISGKDTIYRNIDIFYEYIKDTIAIKTTDTVRDNLHLYLRDHVNH
jgi:hypothetical protein